MKLMKAVFSTDSEDAEIAGYYDENDQPYSYGLTIHTERQQIEDYLNFVANTSDLYSFSFSEDGALTFNSAPDEHTETITPEAYHTPDGPKTLYAFNFGWTWQTVEDTDEQRAMEFLFRDLTGREYKNKVTFEELPTSLEDYDEDNKTIKAWARYAEIGDMFLTNTFTYTRIK